MEVSKNKYKKNQQRMKSSCSWHSTTTAVGSMGSGLRWCGCGVGVFLGCGRVQDTVPTCSMGGGVVEVVALGGVGGRSLLKVFLMF